MTLDQFVIFVLYLLAGMGGVSCCRLAYEFMRHANMLRRDRLYRHELPQ